jgi:hypothetical protein
MQRQKCTFQAIGNQGTRLKDGLSTRISIDIRKARVTCTKDFPNYKALLHNQATITYILGDFNTFTTKSRKNVSTAMITSVCKNSKATKWGFHEI